MITLGRRSGGLFNLLITNYCIHRPIVMALSSTSPSEITRPPSVQACIIGGGVGGCAAAASLLSQSNNNGIHTLLLEMGRGVGGRASTRRSRDDPRLAINHGVSRFDTQTEEGLAILKDLEKRGFAKEVQTTKSALEEDTRTINSFWTGNPDMSSICEGLLEPKKPQYLFRSMVRAVEPILSNADQTVEGWLLKDKEGNILVKTEWLIVAGSGIAHPRWSAAFGGTPPLLEAARELGNKSLDDTVETIGSVHSRPVQVAMMAFELQSNLPFWDTFEQISVLETPGDDILEKVVIQKSEDGSLVSVVAHSTAKFAETAKDTYGSKSTAARIGGATSSKEREQEVLDLLMDAVRRRLNIDMAEPSWGPFLHRWGNAFPEGTSLPMEKALVEDAKVSACNKRWFPKPLSNWLTYSYHLECKIDCILWRLRWCPSTIWHS